MSFTERSGSVFDLYGAFTQRRIEYLEQLIPRLINASNLKTALDAGCGLGDFSKLLSEMGLDMVGFDARAENIAEARARHPRIVFSVANVEDAQVLELGPRDMVLCFGLLYHLENPFCAIRNLYALANKLVLIESRIAPYDLPIAILYDEGHIEDQSLNYVAFVPSETCLVKMLYRAGFSAVYKPRRLPDHDQFRPTFRHYRHRTILIASKHELTLPELQKLSERKVVKLWQRKWKRQAEPLLRHIRRPKNWILGLFTPREG